MPLDIEIFPEKPPIPQPRSYTYQTEVAVFFGLDGRQHQLVFTREVLGEGAYGRAKIVKLAAVIDGFEFCVIKEVVPKAERDGTVTGASRAHIGTVGGDEDSILEVSDTSDANPDTPQQNQPSEQTVDECLQCLKQELVFLTNVQSPFVIKPIGWKFDADGWLIVIERGNHGDLDQLIKNPTHQWDIGQWFFFLSDVMEGTKHLHAKLIEHSDIKAGNVVLCSKDGQVTAKLCDLGMAVRFGTIVKGGTQRSLPSEYFNGKIKADGKVDVYGLGCLAYKMLYKTHPCCDPPEDPNNPDRVFNIAIQKAGEIDCLWWDRQMPAALTNFFNMLTRQKSSRWNIQQASAELEKLYGDQTVLDHITRQFNRGDGSVSEEQVVPEQVVPEQVVPGGQVPEEPRDVHNNSVAVPSTTIAMDTGSTHSPQDMEVPIGEQNTETGSPTQSREQSEQSPCTSIQNCIVATFAALLCCLF